MKRAWTIAGCLTVMLFGTTFARAAWEENRDVPRRVRQEMAAREHQEKMQKESAMTPEEQTNRKEASERRRGVFRKYVIHPIKRLQPHRHPTKGREEEIQQSNAERKEKMNSRFGWLVPHKYPSGRTDTATEGSSTNIQPAAYSSEEAK